MKEQYELVRRGYYLLRLNRTILFFLTLNSIILVLLVASLLTETGTFYVREYIKDPVVLGLIGLLLAITFVCGLLRVLFIYNIIPCTTRQIFLDNETLSYTDAQNRTSIEWWFNFKAIKIIKVRWGYKAYVTSPSLAFSFCSYECDQFPVRDYTCFVDTKKVPRTFYHLANLFQVKATRAEVYTDFFVMQKTHI